LIGISEDDYEVVQVEKVGSDRNLIKDSVYLTVDQKGLKGAGYKELHGYSKLNFQNFVQRIKKEDYKEDMESYLELGSNKFVLDTVSEVDKNSYTNNVGMNYLFSIPDYVRSHGDELYVNLNLERYLTTLKLKKDREVPVLFTNTKKIKQNFTLEIPQGYAVEFLPENSSGIYDGFGFQMEYKKDDDKIIYQVTIDLDILILNKDQFVQWNSFLKELEKGYNNSIVFKKIS